ncbi:hypothetical protein C9374_014383 [Naegleria lovaniensis]|uniref:C2 domain-containing protein n=1 Tax=Naegleria lovaniensis TaxID=51637 RepID=A0AA88GYZ9_NAELO|nr:uncharacterized protein C9374_014383 [Naegleria lovaniensis]KAG2388983.1 hypothetical protein C9374_014383 [Naegleria lovaniensis]
MQRVNSPVIGPTSCTITLQDAIEIRVSYLSQHENSTLTIGCLQLNEFGFLTDVLFDASSSSSLNPLFQLSNYHNTLRIPSAHQQCVQSDPYGFEYTQSICVKPNLAHLFSTPKEPLDNGMKLFLKDFKKQPMKANTFVDALYPSKVDTMRKLQLGNSEELMNQVADPMRSYRGRTKCIVIYFEGEFDKVLSPRSNVTIECGTVVLTSDSKESFTSIGKLVIPSSSFINVNRLDSSSGVFLGAILKVEGNHQDVVSTPREAISGNCSLELIGTNLSANSTSIMDAYNNGLIHSSLKKVFSNEEAKAVIEKPYKYFELKKFNSIILSTSHFNTEERFTFEIKHGIVGKNFTINSKAILLDNTNYVVGQVGDSISSNDDIPSISVRSDSLTDYTFSIDLNQVPEPVEKILFVSYIKGGVDTNFVRVNDSVLNVYNSQDELVTSIMATPGAETTLIFGVLHKLPYKSSKTRWELFNMDQYTDEHGSLGAYRYAVRHLPIVSPMNDKHDGENTFSEHNPIFRNKGGIPFSPTQPLQLRLKLGKRLPPFLSENETTCNVSICYFDPLGYYVHQENAKLIKNKFTPQFKLNMKEDIADCVHTAFIKVSLKLPQITLNDEPSRYEDIDVENESPKRIFSHQHVASILDEQFKLLLSVEHNVNEYGFIVHEFEKNEQEAKMTTENMSNETVIKPLFETNVVLIKLEKIDNSSIWKFTPIRNLVPNDSLTWAQIVKQRYLAALVKAREPTTVLALNTAKTLPLTSDVNFKGKFTHVLCMERSENVTYKPKINILTPTSFLELNDRGNNACSSVQIITNPDKFYLCGENSIFEVAFQEFDFTDVLETVLNLELMHDLNDQTSQSLISLKLFDLKTRTETFKIEINPSSSNWKNNGDVLSVLAILKDLSRKMIQFKRISVLNEKNYSLFMSPKTIKVTIEKAEILISNIKEPKAYVACKFSDGKSLGAKKNCLYSTQVCSKSYSPSWNETFEIPIIAGLRNDKRSLVVHILSAKKFKSDLYLGCVTLPMQKLVPGSYVYPIEVNPLENQVENIKGNMHLSFEFKWD